MVQLALFFFVIAALAGMIGFSGMIGTTAAIALVLFGLFAVLFLSAMLVAFVTGRRIVS